jgi:hypothetical protein
MRITSCVPLVGHGVVARHGGLAAVTDGRGADTDPLLRALAETIQEAGDGSDLVLRASRAAVNSHGNNAWACAGVTEEGLAVFVHGRAAATVRVDDGPEVTLSIGDSRLPVSRTFNGATVAVILLIGGASPPDERFRLGDGVVQGGGLAVTATAGQPAAHRTDFDGRGFTQDSPTAEDGAVFVDGSLCAGGHFNDPDAWTCRDCGIGMPRPPRYIERRPRPPLGELLLDDGTRAPLDTDYVLGREPTLDGEVLAGRVRPMLINDPNGTVSRLHLKIFLSGWRVEVCDLGSANGSVVQVAGEERTLVPFAPTTIELGAQIRIGHRSIQYVSYQGARS